MLNLEIRLCKESEYKAAAEVFMRSFIEKNITEQSQKSIERRFKLLFQEQMTDFYIAIDDSDFIGLTGVTNHNGCSYLGFVSVLPTRRRMGIGSRLVQVTLNKALKVNPTVKLFSNPGIEDLYHRFGFVDEYQVHFVELSKEEKLIINPTIKVSDSTIPEQLLELDKKAIGYDRSKYLQLLIANKKGKIAYLEDEGFAIWNGQTLGPIIGTSSSVIFSLIDYFLQTGSKRTIIADSLLSKFVTFHPKIIQSCMKMNYGKPLTGLKSCVFGYNSFAMG